MRDGPGALRSGEHGAAVRAIALAGALVVLLESVPQPEPPCDVAAVPVADVVTVTTVIRRGPPHSGPGVSGAGFSGRDLTRIWSDGGRDRASIIASGIARSRGLPAGQRPRRERPSLAFPADEGPFPRGGGGGSNLRLSSTDIDSVRSQSPLG